MGCQVDDTPKRSVLATIPEWCVEVLFPYGATGADGDWTDITPRVQQVHIRDGRSRELDQFDAAECDVTLWSKDRLFDPDNAAGPYYPWLRSLRQIRVSAVWAGVRYPMFRGHIDTWPQTSNDDADGIVQLKAFDAFKYFSRITLPGSMYEMIEITGTPPDHWWRFDDPQESTIVRDQGTATPVDGTVRAATLGNTSIVPFDGGRTCAGFTIAAGQTGIVFGYGVSVSSGMTLAVGAGSALFTSTPAVYAGGTVTLDPADSAFGTSRYDMISLANDGSIVVTKGVAAVVFPAEPEIPSGNLALARAFIPPLASSPSELIDRRSILLVQGGDIVWPAAPWPQSTNGWTVGVWFAANAAGGGAAEVLTFGGIGGAIAGLLQIELGFGTEAGILNVSWNGLSFDATTSWNSTSRYDDALVHSVWVTLSPDHKIRIYVDGTLVQTSADQTGNLTPFGTDAFSVGSFYQAGVGSFPCYFSGSISEVTTRDGVGLSDTQILTRHLAGVNGLAGEDTGTQIGRLLDFAGWPA